MSEFPNNLRVYYFVTDCQTMVEPDSPNTFYQSGEGCSIRELDEHNCLIAIYQIQYIREIGYTPLPEAKRRPEPRYFDINNTLYKCENDDEH